MAIVRKSSSASFPEWLILVIDNFFFIPIAFAGLFLFKRL
jgi:hypothetical protein